MSNRWISVQLYIGVSIACLAATPLFGQDRPDAAVGAEPMAGDAAAGAFDEFGGAASTHIIVRTRPNVAAVLVGEGRWTFTDRAMVNQHDGMAALDEVELLPPEAALADALERKGIRAVRPALVAQPQNEALARELGLDRYYILKVPRGSNTKAIADSLRNDGAIGDVFESIELDGVGGIAGSPPNDPKFGEQYAIENIGQTNCTAVGIAGADINVLAAWDIATGSNDLVIAVLDSGVNSHIDLSGRVLPGFDVFACNCAGGNQNCDPASATQEECESDGGTWIGHDDTTDGCSSHGTGVSGIIAANTNNGVGIAGITWSSSILPVVVVNPCGGNESHVASGLVWATDAGADIVNMSLQYYTGTSLLHNAVLYARASGAVLVAATGNFQAPGTVAFPAKWPEVIAVAASNNRDEKWSGSNSGPQVDVCAAGECVHTLASVNSSSDRNGTSFATPQVVGTVALMLSLNPALTHDEIQEILEQTAVDIEDPGWDVKTGHGRIDAYAALVEVQAGITVPGDLNGDQTVGVADLLLLLASWGECADCSPGECPADLNSDCAVGVADLLILLENWG